MIGRRGHHLGGVERGKVGTVQDTSALLTQPLSAQGGASKLNRRVSQQ